MRVGEVEERAPQHEGDGEARSGGHQPDHVKRVKRLEAGFATSVESFVRTPLFAALF